MQEPLSVQRDRRFGNKAEKEFQQVMNNQFKLDLKTTDQYCFVDFVDENRKILFELKGRKNHKNTYPTTVIGLDKIERFQEYNSKRGGKYRLFLVFKFFDGFFYFQHRDDYKYKYHKFRRNKREGWNDKRKDYIFLPVGELKPISSITTDVNRTIMVRYNV